MQHLGRISALVPGRLWKGCGRTAPRVPVAAALTIDMLHALCLHTALQDDSPCNCFAVVMALDSVEERADCTKFLTILYIST